MGPVDLSKLISSSDGENMLISQFSNLDLEVGPGKEVKDIFMLKTELGHDCLKDDLGFKDQSDLIWDYFPWAIPFRAIYIFEGR